ncbi:MAG: putative DCC family thiol-disulfide oxidoreductase YuxK [Candidatus Omnitrophota bacterium]|jgi:predicted DCC family thiol-disulfide oxidoreductase YuxK
MHKEKLTIPNPPPKPLLIFDGDCGFCRRWIKRWKSITGDSVTYSEYQIVSDGYPEIDRGMFKKSVVFIDTHGSVLVGAEAVYASIAINSKKRWLLEMYRRITLFRFGSDVGYALIAANRMLFSRIEKFFLEAYEPNPCTLVADVFFKLIGLVYVIAFISAGLQMTGLAGQEGILPIVDRLQLATERFGDDAKSIFLTLSWWNTSDTWLEWQCWIGAAAGTLVFFGWTSAVGLTLCFILYLSICVAGGIFYSFQWDALLLEAGFLSIIAATLYSGLGDKQRFSKLWVFLFRWLLFRLIFGSGFVKLASLDPVWRDLTALATHYETQPLPNVLAWYIHQFPIWFHKLSCMLMLGIELCVPFFFFGTRKMRLFAFNSLALLMLMIMLTGNYCFFNLLTLIIALFLLDDMYLPSKLKLWAQNSRQRGLDIQFGITSKLLKLIMTLIIFIMTLTIFLPQIGIRMEWPNTLSVMQKGVRPLRIFNRYGLFADMTTERPEISIEGSMDAINWKPYEFHFKPQKLEVMPQINIPYQPRLDWQMWFAALGSIRYNPWILSLAEMILKDSKEVPGLFKQLPFEGPPKYIRLMRSEYRFTDASTRKETGRWWNRSESRPYSRTLTLNADRRLIRHSPQQDPL